MKLVAISAVFAAAFTATAAADSRYDQKLEQAVRAIVAARIGEIRGGFSYDTRTVFITMPDPISTGATAHGISSPAADGWTDGLAVAVERKVAPLSF